MFGRVHSPNDYGRACSRLDAVTDQPPFEPYPHDAARREYDAAPPTTQPPTEQPLSIRRAVLLMRTGAALSAVYLVATLIFLGSVKDDIRAQLQKSDANYTQSQLDTAFTVYFVSVVIFGLIGIALWLWMAAANGRGKRWARTTATVLGAFNILLSVLSLISGNGTTLSVLFTVLNLVIAIAALVFMYRSDASRYYAARSRG